MDSNDWKVSLLSFNLKNQSDQIINYIDLDKDDNVIVKISCTIFFPEKLKENIISNLEGRTYPHIARIYSLVSFKNLYIADQHISLKLEDLKKSNFMRLEFQFNCPRYIKSIDNETIPVENCHIQLTYSTKHDGEMGINETIRLGTFLETTIPVYEVKK